MTLTLTLGVIDEPYLNEEGKQLEVTTGDVAQILEKKYHVMSTFFQLNESKIYSYIENSLNAALNATIAGENVNQFSDAENRIERDFRQFLTSKIMDGLNVPGVPTQASLAGISHLYKWSIDNSSEFKLVRGKKVTNKPTGVPRPSFIDTGMYQAAFKAWFEES